MNLVATFLFLNSRTFYWSKATILQYPNQVFEECPLLKLVYTFRTNPGWIRNKYLIGEII